MPSDDSRDCKLAAAIRCGLWDDSIMWAMLHRMEKISNRLNDGGERGEWTCSTYLDYGLHSLCPHEKHNWSPHRNRGKSKDH
jgi:hypothetical protein